MEIIQLNTYSIYIGNFWSYLNDFLWERKYHKIAVLTDENTSRDCFPILKKKAGDFEFIEIKIPAGEQYKNIETCQKIWSKMMEKGLCRKSLTINLGGGVIGDMGGFCASTFKRGMDFVQIPTTLLSQVDASIGGKLGIDFQQIKNSVGVFNNPQAVFVSSEFFDTLPFNEIRSGFAEIIKHTLIEDAEQWKNLQEIEDLSKVDWAKFLAPSLEIKKRIVEQDPFEKGLRKALNFGHTIGHAIEGWALETDKPLLHGEAIAIGMICEAWLSHKIVNLSKTELHKITDFFLKFYEPYPLNQSAFSDFLKLMTNDKKNENNQINFSLISKIGKCEINQTANENMIIESLKFYNSLL